MKETYGFTVTENFGGRHAVPAVVARGDAAQPRPDSGAQAPRGAAEFGDRKSLLVLKAYLENQLRQIDELLKG